MAEDRSRSLQLINISLERIFTEAICVFPSVKDICTVELLFKMLKAMFPSIKKSMVAEKGNNEIKRKTSVIGLTFEVRPKTPINFTDLQTLIPAQWKLLQKTNEMLKLGLISLEKFNGNSVITELIINNTGFVQVLVAGKSVDLSEFLISNHIKFNTTAVDGLFRTLNTFSLCHGAPLNPGEVDIFSSGRKSVKERVECNETSKTVIRHIDCIRVVSLNSKTGICLKCSQCKKSRKIYNLNKNISTVDKENVDPNLAHLPTVIQELKKIAPNLNSNQLMLIATQMKSSECTSASGMRWPKEVISMSLTLYNRNPSAYRDITKNGWVNLPSESLLYLYKSAVKQRPGIIPEMMQWMRNEAINSNISNEGLYGGIILDEMSIQEDLQIVNQGRKSSLYGLVECEADVMLMHNINEGRYENKLANHVMQYLFHGLTGFRWPFANYPTTQFCPADIFVSTWKCIDSLYEWGFKPIYCCMDGSSNNRTFLKMHFPENEPLSTEMVARHFKNPARKMIFIMDPCHLIKKLRNSVLSSGIQKNHQRLLTVGGKSIQWQMWIDAYNWDQNNHSFKIHHRLSQDHIHPNNAQKMRNKLAFETLDSDMLHLMKTYSNTLGEAGKAALSGAVEFLKASSILVSFFGDPRPVKDMSDVRLNELKESYNWFKAWEKEVCQSDTSAKRYKSLITMETREDLDFMYFGVMSLIKLCIEEIHTEIVPARLNSDIIENIFCQQRSLYHGPTTNPTYNSYRTGINSVIIGETVVSKKSNSGRHSASPFVAEIPPKKLRL